MILICCFLKIYFRATDPSEFSIQFFCNNVHRPDNTSLVNLGTLDYKEELSTILDCHTNVIKFFYLIHFTEIKKCFLFFRSGLTN